MSVRNNGMQRPAFTVPSRPPHPSPFLYNHHRFHPYQNAYYRPPHPRPMATNQSFGNNDYDFGTHLEERLVTPVPPCGTPSMDHYMPDHETLPLTQWRKSPASSNTMTWGAFRAADFGTGVISSWHLNGDTGYSGLGFLNSGELDEMYKLEGNTPIGANMANAGTEFGAAGTEAANNTVAIGKVNNSPVQPVHRHPTYPAVPPPPRQHGINEATLRVDTDVQGASDTPPTQVNPSDYELVGDNDWPERRALGQDADSPATIDTSQYDPLTPPGDVGIAPQKIALSNPSALSHVQPGENGRHTTGFAANSSFGIPTPFPSFSSNDQALPNFWNPGTDFTYQGDPGTYANAPSQTIVFNAETQAPLPAPRPTRLPSTTSFENMERSAMDTTPEPAEAGDADADEDEQTESEIDINEINDQAVNEARHRRERDRHLLEWRRQGLSYKEIKRRGRFREAESTLRGRVRVLTKKKEDRVRKPEWTIDDIELLREAVQRYADDDEDDDGNYHHTSRMPWKRISTWMKQHGSSYKFAPATCAKKWKEIR